MKRPTDRSQKPQRKILQDAISKTWAATSSHYFRSKAERLADHLREGIARGEIVDPLPGTRAWSKTLGVSRTTLLQAFVTLRREKLLSFKSGFPPKLKTTARRAFRTKSVRSRVVRILMFSRNFPYYMNEKWFFGLSLRLSPHDIHLSVEVCSHTRLKAISKRTYPPHEMFLLWLLPATFLSYFSRWTHNALLIGHPAPSSPLSYLAVDFPGPIRRAAQSLLSRGFSRISLLTDPSTSQGVVEAVDIFEKTCRDWPRQPIVADCHRMSMEVAQLRADARRFARKVQPRHGLIILRPSVESMIVTALLERNLMIPRDVEIHVVGTGPEGIYVCPPVIFYPQMIDDSIRIVSNAIFHYFETGSLSPMRKTMSMEANHQSEQSVLEARAV